MIKNYSFLIIKLNELCLNLLKNKSWELTNNRIMFR